MYNNQETHTLIKFAESTILHMEQLIKALHSVNVLTEQNKSFQSVTHQLSTDLEEAKARIQLDEATIQIKDSELQFSQKQIQKLLEAKEEPVDAPCPPIKRTPEIEPVRLGVGASR